MYQDVLKWNEIVDQMTLKLAEFAVGVTSLS